MNTNQNWIVLFVVATLAGSAHAKGLISVGVEPIIGYERTQKLVPTPHTKDRLVYGARLTAGVPLVSAEAEVTQAQDTELFPEQDLSIKDTTQRAKLGIRSSIKLISIVSLIIRGGGQATQTRNEQTLGGVTTVEHSPIRYNPYAGAGLRVRMGKNMNLNGDVVTVFRDFPNMNNNEYQTTLGLSISFP